MKKIILSAVLILPFAAPAYAGVGFIELTNNAGVSYIVSAGGANSGASVGSGASAATLIDAVSGVDASAPGTGVAHATAPYTNTPGTPGTQTHGASSTVFGALITTGPHAGTYLATTTQQQNQSTTVITGTNRETAAVSTSQDVSSFLNNASSGSILFSGDASTTFSGLVTGVANPSAKPATSTQAYKWTNTTTGYYLSNTQSGGLPTGTLVGSTSTVSGAKTAVGAPVAGLTTQFATTDSSGSATVNGGSALAGIGSNSAVYIFSVSTYGSISVNWADNLATNVAANGYRIQLVDTSNNNVLASDWTSTVGSGTDVLHFTSGGTYAFSITENIGVNSPDYLSSIGGVNGAGSSAAAFDFSITAVPEASTWIMMMAGFLGLGMVGARNKKQVRGISA